MTESIERPVRARGLRIVVMVLVAAAAMLAGLVAMRIAESTLADGRTFSGPLIDLRLAYNRGVAFSVGEALPTWAVVAVSGIIIVVGAVWLLRNAGRITWLALAGGSLLLGGALGNLIDRLAGGGVVDYFHTGWFATFNLADVFVTGGVIMLVAGLSWGSRRGIR